MRTYLIFNQKTGEIVQTHVEAEDLQTCPDDLLKTVDPSHDRMALDVLAVEEFVQGECYRVDVSTKTVCKVDREEVAGFGGGASRAVGLRQDPQFVKTVYTEDSPNKSSD